MASYHIAQHFKDLRADTGRKKGRPSPFATGFEDDSEEEERKRRSRSKTKTSIPVENKPRLSTSAVAGPSKNNVASPFASIDALRDSDDDDFLNVAPRRTDRRLSPAPNRIATSSVSDGAQRRGSIDRTLAPSRNSRAAVVQAAGTLALLDDSDDEDDNFIRHSSRSERRPSPAPNGRSHKPPSRSPGGTPRGHDRLSPTETAKTCERPSTHTVASPFAGTKYLQDSDSDEEAVESRQGSVDGGVAPNDATSSPGKLVVERVDKPKTSGVSWRAFSAGRTEQRNAEVEALQNSLRQRGTTISFCPTARTDDGQNVPLSPTAERSSFSARGRPNIRKKSPPRRTEDTRPADDEITTGGPVQVYDPEQFKTNPFTDEATVTHPNTERVSTNDLEALPAYQTSESTTSQTHDSKHATPPSPASINTKRNDGFDSIAVKMTESPTSDKYIIPHAMSAVFSPSNDNPMGFPSRHSSTRSLRSSTRPVTSRRISRRATSNNTSISPAHAFLSSWSRTDRSEEDAMAQAEPDEEGQSVGLNGEYIIGRTINKGGFGVVKEIHSIDHHGKRFLRAVKIVRKTLPHLTEIENEKLQQELEHEVSVWRHLSHRHILALHAVYDTDFATFCIMDLNTGGTLFDLVRESRTNNTDKDSTTRKGLPPHLARRYAYQLTSALRYLHEDMRVCHRDIKLENCLIDMTGPTASTEGGRLRLTDFGLADFLHNDESLDETTLERYTEHMSLSTELSTLTVSSVIGTLEYASPRGLSVHRKLFETAGDIWAFGVVVYALCTGRLPFKHAIPSRTAELILRAEWDDVALKDAAAGGEEVIDLVRGCFEKDIDLRLTVNEAIANPWFDGCREVEDDLPGGSWK